MTQKQRDELRRLLAKATPGPWVYMGDAYAFEGAIVTSVDGTRICDTPESDDRPADMALIVTAVNSLPGLLGALEAAERRLLIANGERDYWRIIARNAEAIMDASSGEVTE